MTTAEQTILDRAQHEGRQDDAGQWILACYDCRAEFYTDKMRVFYRGGRGTTVPFTIDVLCGRCWRDAMHAERAKRAAEQKAS